MLRSTHDAKVIEDDADALWAQVHVTSDSLALNVPSSVARNTPDSWCS
jgi:hypothetical protein